MGNCDNVQNNCFLVHCVYEIGNEQQDKFVKEIKEMIENQMNDIKKCEFRICEYNEFKMKIVFRNRRDLRMEVIYDDVPNTNTDVERIKNLLINKMKQVSGV